MLQRGEQAKAILAGKQRALAPSPAEAEREEPVKTQTVYELHRQDAEHAQALSEKIDKAMDESTTTMTETVDDDNIAAITALKAKKVSELVAVIEGAQTFPGMNDAYTMAVKMGKEAGLDDDQMRTLKIAYIEYGKKLRAKTE
jgi:hypothetical protein